MCVNIEAAIYMVKVCVNINCLQREKTVSDLIRTHAYVTHNHLSVCHSVHQTAATDYQQLLMKKVFHAQLLLILTQPNQEQSCGTYPLSRRSSVLL